MKTPIVLLTMMVGLIASAQECGLVKWFDVSKGIGFISPVGKMHGNDLFVSWKEVMPQQNSTTRGLQPNDKVVYDRVDGPDGIQAHNVRAVSAFSNGVCK